MSRPAVHTPRQARQRLQVALNALTDVWRARNEQYRGRHIVPNHGVQNVAEARSHVRAALSEYDHFPPSSQA